MNTVVWVLIVSLSSYQGSTIQKVEGFTSYASCEQAKKEWLKAEPGSSSIKATAVCVQKS